MTAESQAYPSVLCQMGAKSQRKRCRRLKYLVGGPYRVRCWQRADIHDADTDQSLKSLNIARKAKG